MNTIIETQPPTAAPDPGPAHGPRPRLPRWLRAVLTPVWFILTMLAVIAVVGVVPGLGSLMEDNGWAGLGATTLASLATMAAMIGLVVVLMRFIDRRSPRRAGLVWTRHSLPGLLAGLGVAVVVVGTTIALAGAFGRLERVPLPPEALTANAVAMTIVYGVVRAFPLQGIPEELVFRGYLLQVLAARPRLACWVSATLFGAIHVASNGGQQSALDHVLYLATPFGFGLLAAALAVRLRSVWPAVGIHAGYHVSTIPLQLLGLSPDNRFFWLAGGALFLVVALAVLHGTRAREVVLDR